MARNTVLFSLIHKRFLLSTTATNSSRTPIPTSISSSFTVQFLVDSCGLPLHSAISASGKLQINKTKLHNPLSVLQFLKSRHFENTHIAKLIQKWPKVLHCRVERNLEPKFDFLMENGYVGELLPDLIISNPRILRRDLDSCIKKSFQFLKSFLLCNDKVMVALKRASWLLTEEGTVRPAIDFLIKEGIPVDRIQKSMIWQPRTVLYKQYRMVYAVNSLRNLGLQPADALFTHALHVMLCMSESTWRKKFEVMKSLGWTEGEIWGSFKRCPRILTQSEKKIRNATDFLMNVMGLERQIIIAYPYLLSYSVEKRIRPRYNVIKVLEAKELLLKGNKKIAKLLTISEKKFLEAYVTKYADNIPGLLETYGSSENAKKTVT